MFSKRIFHLINKIALFAIVFASLAPSVSHAIAAAQGINSLTQEICTSNGETITIQVITTQGQVLDTALTSADETAPTNSSALHHLNHCPFCSNPNTDHGVEPPHVPIVAFLAVKTQKLAVTTQAVLPRFSVLPPPAQAPPQL